MRVKIVISLIVILILIYPSQHKACSEGIKGDSDASKVGGNEGWNITNAIMFVVEHQRVDGGFGEYGQVSVLNYTALSLMALYGLGEIERIDLDRALEFLMLCWTGDGFGAIAYPDYPDLLSTWYGVKILYRMGRLDLIDVEAVRDYVLSLPWNTLVDIALIVDILYMLGYGGRVDADSLVSYITEEPPDGVSYGGVGFLNIPTDLYPTVISTWAGIKILKILGALDRIDSDRVSEFIARAQNLDGGFRSSEYAAESSGIEYTYFATSAMAMLGKLDRGNMGFAALYSVIVANNATSLRDVLYALLTLKVLENVIVPLRIDVDKTSVRKGERIHIDLRLINVYGDPIDGAYATIILHNLTAVMFNDGDGIYNGTIDTGNIPNGTYELKILAERDPYIKLEHTVNVTVLQGLKLEEIYYNKTIRACQKIRILLRLSDGVRPISGATVKVTIQGREAILEDLGGGIYVGNITPLFPSKNATLIITASKKGYSTLCLVFCVEVLPPRISQSTMFITKFVAYAIMIMAILLVARITVEDLILSYGIFTLMLAMANLTGALSINADLTLLGITILLTFSIGLRRRNHRLIGLSIMVLLVGILGVLFGPATYFLASIMFMSAVFAYLVSPGERDIIFRDLVRNTVSWFVSLIAFSLGFNLLQNPFSVAGGLAPPAGIGMSLAGYIALLWYCVFVFWPIMTASKYAYIISSGLRTRIRALYARITGASPELEGREEVGEEVVPL